MRPGVQRVARRRIVIMTFDPARIATFWFYGYLPPQANAETVAFYLGEGQVKIGDAIPTDGGSRPTFGRLEFPVRDWTYSVVIADHGGAVQQGAALMGDRRGGRRFVGQGISF